MSAHFGRCECGTMTVWQDGEKARWTCRRCERVAELRTRNEQHAQSLDSALSDAARILASSSDHLIPKPDCCGEMCGQDCPYEEPVWHDAEHIAGMTSTAVLAHIRRWHLND